MKRRILLAAYLVAAPLAGALLQRSGVIGAARKAIDPPEPPDLTAPVGRELHRHLAILRSLDRGPRDVPAVLLGDSIIQCWQFVPDLQDQAFGPGAVNLGVGWDGVENVLWRVRNGEIDPARVRPGVIVLCVGANNLARGDPPAEVARGIGHLAAECRRIQPSARVAVLALPPCGRMPGDPGRVSTLAVNAMLNRTLGEAGVEFVDAGAALLEPDGSIDRAVMPDGLHPSPEGYRRWAEAIKVRFPR